MIAVGCFCTAVFYHIRLPAVNSPKHSSATPVEFSAGVACMERTGQWIEFTVYFWAAASAFAWYRASIFSDTFGGRRKIRTATEITTPTRAAL